MLLYGLVFLLSWLLLLKLLELDSLSVALRLFFLQRKTGYQSFVNYLAAANPQGGVPEYKFYSTMVEFLQDYQRKYGVKIHDSLREIRKAARTDYKEIKKINEQLYGLLFQFIFICVFTWIFITYLQFSLNISITGQHRLLLAIWQLFGGIFSLFAFHLTRRHIFKNFYDYFYTVYIFRSFFSVSIPVSEIIQASKLSILSSEKLLFPLKDRLQLLVKGLRTTGHLPLDELDNLSAELWDIYEQKLAKLSQFTTVIKLLGILFFALPGFLFGIFISMGQLMG